MNDPRETVLCWCVAGQILIVAVAVILQWLGL